MPNAHVVLLRVVQALLIEDQAADEEETFRRGCVRAGDTEGWRCVRNEGLLPLHGSMKESPLDVTRRATRD